MLLLFFYKGERFGNMQMWELRGICSEEDWNAELEDNGRIRLWLNSLLNPKEETDWVWDLRQKERMRNDWGTKRNEKGVERVYNRSESNRRDKQMPRKPKRPCSYPGCPKLVDGQYCEEHQKLVTK